MAAKMVAVKKISVFTKFVLLILLFFVVGVLTLILLVALGS